MIPSILADIRMELSPGATLEDFEGLLARVIASARIQQLVAEDNLTGMAFDDLARVYATDKPVTLASFPFSRLTRTVVAVVPRSTVTHGRSR